MHFYVMETVSFLNFMNQPLLASSVSSTPLGFQTPEYSCMTQDDTKVDDAESALHLGGCCPLLTSIATELVLQVCFQQAHSSFCETGSFRRAKCVVRLVNPLPAPTSPLLETQFFGLIRSYLES